MPPIILNVEVVKKMNKDWLIHTNIEIKGYKQIIDNIINQLSPTDLIPLSTRGFNSIQYEIIEYQDLFLEIQKSVINKIKEYLNFQYKLGSAWTVLGGENSYHTAHAHCETSSIPTKYMDLATVLYLDIPKNPHLHQPGNFYYFLREKEGGISQHAIHPSIGDLIIMPLHIIHGVYPQSKGLRQTLNMDFLQC